MCLFPFKSSAYFSVWFCLLVCLIIYVFNLNIIYWLHHLWNISWAIWQQANLVDKSTMLQITMERKSYYLVWLSLHNYVLVHCHQYTNLWTCLYSIVHKDLYFFQRKPWRWLLCCRCKENGSFSLEQEGPSWFPSHIHWVLPYWKVTIGYILALFRYVVLMGKSGMLIYHFVTR